MVKTKDQPSNYENEIVQTQPESPKKHHDFKTSKKKVEKKNQTDVKKSQKRSSPNESEFESVKKKLAIDLKHKDIKSLSVTGAKITIGSDGYLGTDSDFEFEEHEEFLSIKSKKNSKVFCYTNGSSNVAFGNGSINCVGNTQTFIGSQNFFNRNGVRRGSEKIIINGVEITQEDLEKLKNKKNMKKEDQSEIKKETQKHFLAIDSLQKIENIKLKSSSNLSIAPDFISKEQLTIECSDLSVFDAPSNIDLENTTLLVNDSSYASIPRSKIQHLTVIAKDSSNVNLIGSKSKISFISSSDSSLVQGLGVTKSSTLKASDSSKIQVIKENNAKITKIESKSSKIQIN
tara:strand:- start:79 stop:1113 length:1035 start_codon:yes stop_codon:yes gene_type:complete